VKFLEKAARTLAAKGIKKSKPWSGVWVAERPRAFVVEQIVRGYQLLDVQKALVKSLKDGTTKERSIKELDPLLQQKGWKPKRDGGTPCGLERIYEINRRTASAVGQWNRIQRSKEILPYLLYANGRSRQHCRDHAALAGICLPVNHRFWNTHFPPNGWGCECFVRQVSHVERERLEKAGKIRTTDPPILKKCWIDAETGEERMVAEGIDPSWGYHIGRSPLEGLVQECERLANALYDGIGMKAAMKWIASLLKGCVVGEYMKTPGGKDGLSGMPVAVLPKELVAQGSSPILMLNLKALRKQHKSRGNQYEGSGEDFGLGEYRNLQSLIEGIKVIGSFPIKLKTEIGRETVVLRTVAHAKDAEGRGHAVIWQAVGRRNVLVTFFRPGEGHGNREDYDSWVSRQTHIEAKRVLKGQAQKQEGRKLATDGPTNPSSEL